MLRGVFLVTIFVAFFGLYTPLLLAAQIGASPQASGNIFVIVDKDPTSPSSIPEVYQFSISSLEFPVNAFYIVINYDAKEMSCGDPKPNETDFPLLLETLTNNLDGEIIMALAQPGYGFTSTTTLGSVACTKTTSRNTSGQLVLNDSSRAYAADGFGTAFTIKSK